MSPGWRTERFQVSSGRGRGPLGKQTLGREREDSREPALVTGMDTRELRHDPARFLLL